MSADERYQRYIQWRGLTREANAAVRRCRRRRVGDIDCYGFKEAPPLGGTEHAAIKQAYRRLAATNHTLRFRDANMRVAVALARSTRGWRVWATPT